MAYIQTISWTLALAAAVGFGLVAKKAGRGWVMWGIGGGVTGLVVSVILAGVVDASTIPFSDAQAKQTGLKVWLAAACLVGLLGWLFTLGLHGQFQRLWGLVRGAGGKSV